MNQILMIALLAIFLAMPPAFFTLRFFKGKPSWWIIIAIIVVIGWASVFGAVVFYYQYLGDCINAYDKPPQDLLERWSNDGAKKVFTLFFGWIYAIVYSIPWLLIYVVAVIIRRVKNK